MARSRIRLCLLLAMVLALVALAPALAHAAPPRASIVTSDAYEPDDTTETAMPFAPFTSHTFNDRDDVDWSYVDIDEEGTPILAAADWKLGTRYAELAVFLMNEDGSLTQIDGGPAGENAISFGGPALLGEPTAFLIRAPQPGRYFIRATPTAIAPTAGGTYDLVEGAPKQIRRLSGPNRFATAAAVSRQMWPANDQFFSQFFNFIAPMIFSPKGVIVATGRDFADALAAGAWASQGGMPPEQNMPVLLTEPDSLPRVTAEEIMRLASPRRLTNQEFTVYIVGGPKAVSDNVKQQIEALGGPDAPFASTVKRVGGTNRYGTAAAIASEEETYAGLSDIVFITNGAAFADALSAGPVAGSAKAPILLTGRSVLPAETQAFLLAHPGIKNAVIVGSPSVIATEVASALATAPFSLSVRRVGGATRYQTSRLLAEFGVEYFGMNPTSEVLVSGENFPDGISATALTWWWRQPLLLTRPGVLSPDVETFFNDYPTSRPSYLIGGPLAVSPAVEARFDALRPSLIDR